MLIYFSVANFRSIKNELTLSMSAGRFKTAARDRAYDTKFAQVPCVLRAAAVYGANASGKSSLIGAIDLFQDFVQMSFNDEAGDLLKRVEPYRLNSDAASAPTNFECAFVADGILYTYGFSVDRTRVIEEWLHLKAPEGRTREAFSRVLNEDGYEWSHSAYFPSKKDFATWRKATRDNSLFISTAQFLNAKEVGPVFDWITHTLKVIGPERGIGANVTSRALLEEKDSKNKIVPFLRSADPTVYAITVKPRPFEEIEAFKFFTEEFRNSIIENTSDLTSFDVTFTHTSPTGYQAVIDLKDQSDGTKAMYNFAWPFIQSGRNGFVVVADELDRSLHALLLREVVERFSNPDDLKTRAQLVFTTHDTSLLSSDVLSRDQIWFIDNKGEGSELTPLIEYKPRVGEALQRAYLQGRYGGVPEARQRLLRNAE